MNNNNFELNFFQKSIKGEYRELNEDSIGVSYKSTGEAIFVMCDGMGGHPHGDFASKFITNIFITSFDQVDFSILSKKEISVWLSKIVYKSRNQMIIKSQENSDYIDMGAVITVCMRVGGTVYWVHIGDTRLYYSHRGDIIQITADQNLAATEKSWQRKIFRSTSLSRTSMQHIYSLGKMLTSSLGPTKTFTILTGKITIQNNDVFYLTSDGLHDYINASDLTLPEQHDRDAMSELTDRVFHQSEEQGSQDNISMIIFSFRQV